MHYDVAVLREHGPSTTRHNTAEVPDITVRIVLPIKDVNPFELTTVVLRIERHLVVGVDRRRNNGTEYILMEDVADLVLSSLVSRVDVISRTLGGRFLAERIHADKVIVGRIPDSKPRGIRIDGVVETTVRTLDAERREQFIRLGIPVILANVGIQPDQVFAGFSTADQHEHRGSVFTAHGVSSRAIADKFHVEPFQDALSQLAVRQVGGSDCTSRGGGSGSVNNGVVNNACVARASRSGSHDTVSSGARVNKVSFEGHRLGVQIPVTILPNQGSRLSEDVHDVGELFPTFHREAQVFEGDVRGINRGPFQRVLAEFLTESDASERRGQNVTSSGVGSNGISVSGRACNLGIRIKSLIVLDNLVGTEGAPVSSGVSFDIASGVAVSGSSCDRARGVKTFEGDRADHIAHFLGELFLLGQFEPSRGIDRPAINFRSDTTRFFNKKLLNSIRRRHSSVYFLSTSPLLTQRVGYD